jgi:hypothetical protein
MACRAQVQNRTANQQKFRTSPPANQGMGQAVELLACWSVQAFPRLEGAEVHLEGGEGQTPSYHPTPESLLRWLGQTNLTQPGFENVSSGLLD